MRHSAVIVYKLVAEVLFWVLVATALFFVAEAVLPGFVSSRINFSTFYLVLIATVLPLILLRPFLPETEKGLSEHQTWSDKTVLIVSLLVTLLLANDMHGLSFLASTASLLSIFFVTFFLLSFLFKRK